MKFKILNKVFGSGSAPDRDRFAFLALVKDIEYFPKTDSLGVLLLDDIKMKENCGMMQIYLTTSSQEYSYDIVGESDSKSFKIKFNGTHPGTEQQALEFAANFLEEEFIVLIPRCEKGIKVLGSPDSPLIFTSSHKSVKDSEKFNFVFEQEVGSELIYMLYDGIITLNTNIDIDMKDFLELLKNYIKIDGSNLTEAQKQNLRTILGSDGKNLGNSDLSLSENRSLNLGAYFLNFFSNLGAKIGINKNNPTEALHVGGNIKTDGLIISDIGNPEEVGSIKRNGNEIQFKTSTGWETLMLKGDYVSDSHGIISPNTPAPVGGWEIGWYTPKISSPDPGTNYPNQNDLKSVEGFFTEFYYNGTTWESVTVKMPDLKSFIPLFIESVFPLTSTNNAPIQRIHENSIWLLKPGEIASSTDIPSKGSVKWINIGGSIDLDVNEGALGFDTFLNLVKGAPTSGGGEMGPEVFTIVGGWGNDGGNEGYHYDWNGGRVTDYIPIIGGTNLAITAVSNSSTAVPLFVVYNEAKTQILHRQYTATINTLQTVNYTTPANCNIIVNCALVAQLQSCKIIGFGATAVMPTKLLSDLNKKDFKNTFGGFLGYEEADDMLGFYEILLNSVNFDATMNGFISARRMKSNNVYEDFWDTSCRTLHNYNLNGKKNLRFSGRLYDDRSTYIGLQGIKADGTIVDIYARDGITTAWLNIVDRNFDVSEFTKLTIAVDTSLMTFKGNFDDGPTDEIGSTVIDALRKGKTMKERIISNDTPEIVKGITGTRQEVNVIKFKGKTLMYYGKGWVDENIYVADYNIGTNTATNNQVIINATVTGVPSQTFKCPTAFVAEGKVYLVFSVSTPQVYCMMYESTDGYNFTESSRTLANVSGFNTSLFGNHYIIPNKIDGYYYWFIEGTNSSGVWEMKLMKSQNITTGWSVVGIISGLSQSTGAKGGPCVFYHNGRFKMFYHYSPNNTNLPTWIAYAEADINDPLNFTPYYMPLTTIVHRPWGNSTDQYADPEIHEIDGRTFLFCSIVNNSAGLSELWRWECEGRLYDILNSRI